jgi:hypothetical protein
VVLQSARWGREFDQGSQQRCRFGGPSFRALGHQLRSFSAGHAGLQPQLLAADTNARKRQLKHTTLAIARLRFLFLVAKVWRHAGRVGVSYSDQYAERGLFQRVMDRLRNIAPGEANLAPVLPIPLRS